MDDPYLDSSDGDDIMQFISAFEQYDIASNAFNTSNVKRASAEDGYDSGSPPLSSYIIKWESHLN